MSLCSIEQRRWYSQHVLRCKSREVVSTNGNLPRHQLLTFLMPSGLRCKATSFSGLTTGILNTMLHIIPGERMVFIQQRTKGGKLTLKLAMGTFKNDSQPGE
jgi:hypothetical protein